MKEEFYLIKKKSLLCLSFMLLMFGCDNKEGASESISGDTNSKLESNIEELEQIIEEQQASIDELNTLNEKVSILDESNTYINNKLYVLETLIQHITSYKTAMVNSAEIKGDKLNINITYTDLIDDDDAPNGFRMVETGEGTKVLNISKDVPIFLLEDPSKSIEATWEQIVAFKGFIKLFEEDGKVIFISEVYLP